MIYAHTTHKTDLSSSYYNSSSVCLCVCSLSPPRSFDGSSPNLVGVCRWTSHLPLRGSFSKRWTGRRVNGSLSLSTILYMCQPHATQLKRRLLLCCCLQQSLIRRLLLRCISTGNCLVIQNFPFKPWIHDTYDTHIYLPVIETTWANVHSHGSGHW